MTLTRPSQFIFPFGMVFTTKDQIAALDVLKNDVVYLRSGKKSGWFTRELANDWSLVSAKDANRTWVIPSTNDNTYSWVRVGTVSYPELFGAIGDGSTNDYAALMDWWSVGRALRMKGVHNGLRSLYYSASTLSFNLSNTAADQSKGGKLVGTDPHHCGFSLASGQRVEFVCNTADAAFYENFIDFRVVGNVDNNPILMFGRGDFSDALNACHVDNVIVNNGSQTANAVGIRFNYHLNSNINFVSNCGKSGNPLYGNTGGYGIPCHLRQAQFNTISGSMGNGRTGLLMNDGYVYGNTFMGNFDIEEVYYGIEISGEHVTRNSFLGGTIVAQQSFAASLGGNNIIMPSVNIAPYSGGSVGATTGLIRPSTVSYT